MNTIRLDHLLKRPVKGWFPRMAKEDDFPKLAELFNIANAGAIPGLWNPEAPEGQTWLDMLKPIMFEQGGYLDITNIIVADIDGHLAGMMIINTNPDPWPDEDYSQIKASDLPFHKMLSLFPGYLFLSTMAVFPEFRALRISTNLSDICFNIAIQNNLPGTFVTVHESNLLLLEHCRKRGMVERLREKVVESPVYNSDSDWVLLYVDAPGGFLPE